MSRILIVAPNWIGDCVAAQPLLMRLAARKPGSTITVLAPAWVAPALKAMPEVNAIIVNPFGHGAFKLRERRRFAKTLAGFDEAYVLPNSWKSALIPFFAGIPVRVGFTGELRYGLLNHRHTLDEKRLPRQVERYAQLAEEPGAKLECPLPNPRLARSSAEISASHAALGLAIEPRPVVFCPGAEFGSAKRWPEHHYAELARLYVKEGIPVWILGSKKDAAVATQILRLADNAESIANLCGKTDLTQAIDLIAHARLAITNDSGLMHVAAATGTPLVALFGSSSPGYTPPLSEKAAVISLGLACSPCFKRECPLGHLNCLNGIAPQRVHAEALTLLARKEFQ